MRRSSASQRAPFLVALAIGCTLFTHAGRSNAFCRSRSCEKEWSTRNTTHFAFPCVEDEQGCWAFGPLLHWPTNCLSYSLQRDGSAASAIDLETAEAVIDAAFAAWMTADCGGGEPPSFTVNNRGAVECRKHEYNQRDQNANIFLFRDDSWPYSNVRGAALALTTTTYNVDTGEIVDADIEFNNVDGLYTATDDPSLIIQDFLSIATHEIGHFLGLSHSKDPTATMWESADHPSNIDEPLQTWMRTLEPDDVAGICSIYLPGETLSSSCPVKNGFSGECGEPPPDEGCTIGTPSARRAPVVFSGLALAAVCFLGRRLRRKLRTLERTRNPSLGSGALGHPRSG